MPAGRPDNPVSGAPGIRAVYVVGVRRVAWSPVRCSCVGASQLARRLSRAKPSRTEPIKTYANSPYISISALAKSLFTYSVHFAFALVASLAYA